MFDTDQANCLGIDPEMFFPNGAMSPQTEKLLRKICLNCNVLWDCYDYALHVKVDGFWAGTTDTQRKALRKDLGIEAKRIDEEYIVEFQSQTQGAKNARAKRSRLKEAG